MTLSDAARLATYPHPYPSGWYRVADEVDVLDGKPLPVTALGEELIVFRGRDSGRVAVLDAHCPHMGAHLGAGGKVLGDCVVCPFHEWTFDAEGRVADVPWLDEPPRKVRLQQWPTRIVHGMIWIYYDAGDPGRGQPPYEPEPVPDIADGTLVRRGEHKARDVAMHLVEFAENSVDFQHFSRLHGDMLIPWTSRKVPFIKIAHDASWAPDPDRPHVAVFRDSAHLVVAGRHLPRTGADATITFFGPGGVAWFRFEIPDVGTLVMAHTHTPIEPMRQRVRFTWFAPRRMPRLLVSYVIGTWIAQWHQDLEVWENKVYHHKPAVVRGDGPIHRLRTWHRQLYPTEVTP